MPVRAASLLLTAAVLVNSAAAHGSIPVVTPYPLGSIPIFRHPSVPLIPKQQLLFPSIPSHAGKIILPTLLPGLLGSLPFLHPAGFGLDTYLRDIFPFSADAGAPAPGPSEAAEAEAPALSAEEAPGLDASGTKSLIARKRAAARKHLHALKHRQTILQALDISIPAPAPGPMSGQEAPAVAPTSAEAAALGPIPTPASFNAFFTQLNGDALAPATAPEASAPVVAPAEVPAPEEAPVDTAAAVNPEAAAVTPPADVVAPIVTQVPAESGAPQP